MVNSFLPDIPTQPPGSAIFIIAVSILVAVGTNLISLRFIDKNRLKVYRRIQREYTSLKMKVARGGDKRLARKLELLEKEMSRKGVNKELQSMQMKPMLFTILPMIILFGLLNSYFSGKVVALIPFPLPENLIFPIGKVFSFSNGIEFFSMTYVWWYFTINITIGSLIRKIAGLDPY